MYQEHRGVKQIKSICDLHTTECNVTLYMFVCLWRESTVRKGSVEQTLAAWHLWTECSGQWHGLGGPNRTVLPTTNFPVQESVSNVGVLKLLSLLYCLFCIFDSLKTLTLCECVYRGRIYSCQKTQISSCLHLYSMLLVSERNWLKSQKFRKFSGESGESMYLIAAIIIGVFLWGSQNVPVKESSSLDSPR